MIDFIYNRDFVLVTLGYHLMLECPACAASELGDNDIAISKEVDVEVDVMDWLIEKLAWNVGT